MPPHDVALSLHALSADVRQRLEGVTGREPEYVTFAELVRGGARSLPSALRSLRGTRLLIVEADRGDSMMLPYLKLLGWLSGQRNLYLVTPGLQLRRLNRLDGGRSVLELISASIDGQLAMARALLELTSLLREPRIRPPLQRETRVLQLRTNMSIRLTAGGSVGHTAGIVNAFDRGGYRVDLLASQQPPLLRPGVRFENLPLPRSYGIPRDVNMYRLDHAAVGRVLDRQHDPRYSFVYARLSRGGYAGARLSRALNIPLVLEYNSSQVWSAQMWEEEAFHFRRLATMAEEVCLRHAHLIVTVSAVLRDELLTRGIEPERIVFYPNCIDPAIFDPTRFDSAATSALRARTGIPTDATVVTFIGTFGPWHGIEVLARVIRHLIENDASWLDARRVHFLLVGDGQGMPRVRELLGGERYTPYVTLTGLVPQDQAPAYLAASDIVVASHVPNPDGTRFFGSPTKLFEYMAMGKGIVASDLEQLGQVLHDSLRVDALPAGAPPPHATQLGVLTPPGDLDGLTTGIRFLVDNPEWRVVLGSNARREALARYTWDRHVAAILAALERSLAPS